jgi:hypothetical protein
MVVEYGPYPEEEEGCSREAGEDAEDGGRQQYAIAVGKRGDYETIRIITAYVCRTCQPTKRNGPSSDKGLSRESKFISVNHCELCMYKNYTPRSKVNGDCEREAVFLDHHKLP